MGGMDERMMNLSGMMVMGRMLRNASSNDVYWTGEL